MRDDGILYKSALLQNITCSLYIVYHQTSVVTYNDTRTSHPIILDVLLGYNRHFSTTDPRYARTFIFSAMEGCQYHRYSWQFRIGQDISGCRDSLGSGSTMGRHLVNGRSAMNILCL